VSLTARAGDRLRATRIAVTSGKGGVGKTSLSINLAVAIARLGHEVGLLDADFGLGNIDVMLGLTPESHLGAVLDGTRAVGDVTVEGPEGVRVIPAGSGVRAMTALDRRQWARLVAALDEAGKDLDFLIVDTASGIADNVLDVVGLADYVLVVTSYDPASVVDAYAVIKLLTAADRAKPIGVVVNGARDAEEGGLVFRQIALAAERFLGRSIRYDGFVPEDRAVKDATFAQVPVVGTGTEAPGPASRCIRRLGCRLVAVRPTGAGPWPAKPAPIVTPAALSALTMEAPRCA
jgi:flagellar biosynthesis protein FlhG